MLEAPKTQRDGKDRKLHNTHGANPRGIQAVKAMNQSCPCRRSQHEARLPPVEREFSQSRLPLR